MILRKGMFWLLFATLVVIGNVALGQGETGQTAVDDGKKKPPAVQFRQQNQEQRLSRSARRFEDQGDFERAVTLYQNLADLNPNNPGYYAAILRNLLFLKDYQRALDLIEQYKLRSAGKTTADMLSAFSLEIDRGEVLHKMEMADSAMVLWRQALDRVGYDQSASAKVVRPMMANRLLDEAVALVTQARERGANPRFMAMELALIYRARMEYADATTEFLKVYQHQPTRFSMVQKELSRFPESESVADSVIKALRNALPEDHDGAVRKLLVGFLIRNQRYDEALPEVQILDSLAKQPGKNGFDFAQWFLREDQISHARSLFQGVVTKEQVPDGLKVAARLGLARCLEQEGRAEEAVVQYEELAQLGLRRPEGREARFRAGVVRLHDLGDLAGAQADFQALLAAGLFRIGNQEGGLWLGDCYVMGGNLEAAEQSYDQAVGRGRKRGESVPAVLNTRLARLVLWQGRLSDAAERLNNVVRGKLDDDDTNDALVWSLFLTAAKGDSEAVIPFARGDLMSFRGQHQEAIGAFQDAREVTPGGRVAQESLVRIALEYRALGQPASAADSLRLFLAAYPNSINRDDVQFLLGDILQRDLGDIPAAIEQYEQLLIESPGGMHTEEVRRRIRELEAYRQS